MLKGDANSGHAGKTRRLTLRNSLVVTQMALSLVVRLWLVSSSRVFATRRRWMGFAARGVLLTSLNPE